MAIALLPVRVSFAMMYQLNYLAPYYTNFPATRSAGWVDNSEDFPLF
jgi:hypothetical protein